IIRAKIFDENANTIDAQHPSSSLSLNPYQCSGTVNGDFNNNGTNNYISSDNNEEEPVG
ncbi:8903_t:CDS:2, partial [Gigaspora rosea]